MNTALPASAPALSTGRRVDRRPVAIFVAIAFGLVWTAEAALAATGGLAQPAASIALPAIMFTPLVASVVAARVAHQRWSTTVGLARPDRRMVGRLVGLGLASVLGIMVVVVLSALLAQLLGWQRLDWRMPGLDTALSGIPAAKRPPRAVLAAAQLLGIVVAAFTINGLFALGEETGWRGWLLGALAPLGRTRSSLVVGAVWGLWHAPLIAMGYEYSYQLPFLAGVALFTCFTTAFGVVLAWLRQRSGSVLAAAIAHGALNGAAGLPLLLVPHPGDLRMPWRSVVGLPGVVLTALVAAVLLRRGHWSAPQR